MPTCLHATCVSGLLLLAACLGGGVGEDAHLLGELLAHIGHQAARVPQGVTLVHPVVDQLPVLGHVLLGVGVGVRVGSKVRDRATTGTLARTCGHLRGAHARVGLVLGLVLGLGARAGARAGARFRAS